MTNVREAVLDICRRNGLTDWFGPANGPSGLWQGLIVGLTCAALMLSVRLTRSAKERIRMA